MEYGTVPPTRRGTARPLIHNRRPAATGGANSEPQDASTVAPKPPPRARTGPTDSYYHDAGGNDAQAGGAGAGKSRSGSSEHLQLQHYMKEQSLKYERSQRHQTDLEEEIVAKDAHITMLSEELKLLKTKKQRVESELAQSTADYMNSQTRWLEQVDSLTDEVQVLKTRLAESQDTQKALDAEVAALRAAERQRADEERARARKAADPGNVQVAADALARHQDQLMLKELKAHHEKIKEEIAELRDVNERLRDDNEHFQYLLIEHTIAGGLNAGSAGSSATATDKNPSLDLEHGVLTESSAAGHTLADEEPMEFGIQEANVSNDSSLAEKGSSVASPQSVQSGTSLESYSHDTKDPASGENTDGSSDDHQRKLLAQQQFELRSLHNHNRALKLSLERLVDRLLDNKTFSSAVEESLTAGTVKNFRTRVASSSSVLPRDAEQDASSPPSAGFELPPAAVSNMIFNAHYTGASNRRVFSMGVDSEYHPAPTPYHTPDRRIGSSSSSVASGNESRRPSSHSIKYEFGRPRTKPAASAAAFISPVSAPSPDRKLSVSKRAESITGMRQLHLKE